jgi:hypothetical protein
MYSNTDKSKIFYVNGKLENSDDFIEMEKTKENFILKNIFNGRYLKVVFNKLAFERYIEALELLERENEDKKSFYESKLRRMIENDRLSPKEIVKIALEYEKLMDGCMDDDDKTFYLNLIIESA